MSKVQKSTSSADPFGTAVKQSVMAVIERCGASYLIVLIERFQSSGVPASAVRKAVRDLAADGVVEITGTDQFQLRIEATAAKRVQQ